MVWRYEFAIAWNEYILVERAAAAARANRAETENPGMKNLLIKDLIKRRKT